MALFEDESDQHAALVRSGLHTQTIGSECKYHIHKLKTTSNLWKDFNDFCSPFIESDSSSMRPVSNQSNLTDEEKKAGINKGWLFMYTLTMGLGMA